MKAATLDVLAAIWIIFAGAGFVTASLLGWMELATVIRFVYVVVLAAGLISLALRLGKTLAAR